MTVTDALKTTLRRLLAEKVPDGGSASDTRFDDDEIESLIEDASNIYAAASQGWLEKAGMVRSELGDVAQHAHGDSSWQMTALKDLAEYCDKMSAHYSGKAKSGSLVIQMAEKDALDYGDETSVADDLRYIGGSV